MEARFRQERLNARDDKLRAEIATLLTAEGELGSRHDIVFSRLVNLVSALNLDELTDEQLQEPAREAKSIVFAELADVFRRILICGLTIRMLTTDTAITRGVALMDAAVRGEQQMYMNALAVPAIRHLTWDGLRQQLKPYDIWAELAEHHLTNYSIRNLGVDIYDMRSPSGWPTR